MTYNIDFLIAAMVILLLVLWYFLGQKRAEDLNNQVFLFFAIIGILDVVAELASNYYISFPNSNCEIAAMLATTIFYLLQALLPFTVICYIQTLHDNKIISAKKDVFIRCADIHSDGDDSDKPVHGKAVLF